MGWHGLNRKSADIPMGPARKRPPRHRSNLPVAMGLPAGGLSNYLPISAPSPIRAWWPQNGGIWHQYAGFTGSPRRFLLDSGVRDRHSPDVAGAGAVERLSAAPVGHRRVPGALVRRLSGPQPLHRVRPLSAFRRGLKLLDQSRHPGAGDTVAAAPDPA